MIATSVLKDIDDERIRQDVKWGGPTHDDEHDLVDWCEYIEDRLQSIFFLSNAFDTEEEANGDRESCRRKLVQVAALAVAALESFDRKHAKEQS